MGALIMDVKKVQGKDSENCLNRTEQLEAEHIKRIKENKERWKEVKPKYLEWIENEIKILKESGIESYKDKLDKCKNDYEITVIINSYDNYIKSLDILHNAILALVDTDSGVLNSIENYEFDYIVLENFLKLLKHKPISVLNGTDDEWVDCTEWESTPPNCRRYCNRRYVYVQKYVYEDKYEPDNKEKVIYVDYSAVNLYNRFNRFYQDDALILKLFELGIFKIQFPYEIPETPYMFAYTDIYWASPEVKEGEIVTVTKAIEVDPYTMHPRNPYPDTRIEHSLNLHFKKEGKRYVQDMLGIINYEDKKLNDRIDKRIKEILPSLMPDSNYEDKHFV